ncbi:MCE family protein [Pseudonocardia spinosispora]|uniref:MCE family protein n=1 Tax=Pseudonocardia spinosispora TaxID=103441 RepID=UPI0006876970|nr:MCE family protein [Pseudonocardia spinosispora]
MNRRVATKVVAVGLSAGLLSGCGSITLQGIPLPGGADLGSSPYQITVQMRDVLDLVPQSSVKVNNVSVGQVKDIDLDPKTWLANVHLQINGGVALPANADAQLKQTTLLGEKYIELGQPTDGPPQGKLVDGATIPVQRTNRFPEAEEIFGALSMLLNGGGIGQLQSISKELNTALNGHEGDAKALLNDLNTLTTTLDAQKGNITRALDGVDRLSARLADQKDNLDVVLTDLEPGLAVLEEQRPQLVGMLKALDRLSDVANDVVDRSQDDLVADLRALQPTLRELAKSGDALPKSLQILATPPFTDSATGAVRGDHMNLKISIDLNIQDLLDNLLNASTPPVQLPTDPLMTLPVAPLQTLDKALPKTPLGGLELPGLGGGDK